MDNRQLAVAGTVILLLGGSIFRLATADGPPVVGPSEGQTGAISTQRPAGVANSDGGARVDERGPQDAPANSTRTSATTRTGGTVPPSNTSGRPSAESGNETNAQPDSSHQRIITTLESVFVGLDENDIRRAVEGVGSDWGTFLTTWADSSEVGLTNAASLASVTAASREELLRLYLIRAKLYREVVDAPELHEVCSSGFSGDDTSLSPALREYYAASGPINVAALARWSGGATSWTPPVPFSELTLDGAKQVLAVLEELNASYAVELLDGAGPGPDDTCRGVSELYDSAARHPDTNVGGQTLLDFVRSVEYSLVVGG